MEKEKSRQKTPQMEKSQKIEKKNPQTQKKITQSFQKIETC